MGQGSAQPGPLVFKDNSFTAASFNLIRRLLFPSFKNSRLIGARDYCWRRKNEKYNWCKYAVMWIRMHVKCLNKALLSTM